MGEQQEPRAPARPEVEEHGTEERPAGQVEPGLERRRGGGHRLPGGRQGREVAHGKGNRAAGRRNLLAPARGVLEEAGAQGAARGAALPYRAAQQ